MLRLSILLILLSACSQMVAPQPESAAPQAQALLSQTSKFCVGTPCTVTSEATGVVRGNGMDYTMNECFVVHAGNVPAGTYRPNYGWGRTYDRSSQRIGC